MILGRLGRMAYINTLPVDWGVVSTSLGRLVEIRRGSPTQLNRLLAEGQIDVSPVSCVAAAEHADDWLVVDRLCIGCHGAVGSVILHTNRPIEDMQGTSIAATNASATAVLLLKLLLSRHWQIEVDIVPEDRHAEGRLLIGDTALRLAQSHHTGYVHDLGAAWKDHTGESFVFGLWCMRRKFAEDHPAEARSIAKILVTSYITSRLSRSEIVVEASQTVGLPLAVIRRYFGQLAHELDDRLWSGMRSFLKMAGYAPERLMVFRAPMDGAQRDSGGEQMRNMFKEMDQPNWILSAEAS